MAKKRRQEEEEHENEERWLVTYADMITLLMVLFIVLFAMATVDAKKFEALKDSFSGKHPDSSILEGAATVVDGGTPQLLDDTAQNPDPQIELPSAAAETFDAAQAAAGQDALTAANKQAIAEANEKNNFKQAEQEIQAALDKSGLGDQAKFTIEKRGLVVTVVTDRVLFEPGKSNIKPAGTAILNAIGSGLSQLPNDVAVEGYTDNTPIATAQYPTNWELSTARATSVTRYLVDQHQVDATRIGATGYGEFRPAVPNDSAEHRAQNRRVEIVVLSDLDK